MHIDTNLLYTKTHEWVRMEGNKAYIGITDFAQEQLGDIVFVEMPEQGEEVNVGEKLGIIESVKTVATVYAPLAGKVIAINEELESAPELLNSAPYTSYISVVEILNPQELEELLSPAAYQVICDEEAAS